MCGTTEITFKYILDLVYEAFLNVTPSDTRLHHIYSKGHEVESPGTFVSK